MAYRTLILMWCCVIHNLTFAQCYYTKRKFEISNFCKTYTIKSDFEKGLNKMRYLDTIFSLVVLNKYKTIQISDTLFNREIGSIDIGKVSNDRAFCNVRKLRVLNYICDTFNNDVLNSKDLERLHVDVLNDSIRPNLFKINKKIKHITLISKYEYELDSSYIYFKNMVFLGGSFNPFTDKNYNIFSQMPNLTHLNIVNIDFRNFDITPSLINRISKCMFFKNCKFTQKQKALLKKYFCVYLK